LIKIALVSLNHVWENKQKNKQNCITYIKKAADQKAEIVIFPEMTLTGFSMKSREIAEDIDGSETIEFFRKMALEYFITIVFGIVLFSSENPTNNLFAISPEGKILVKYTKIHPFTYSSEDKYYTKGNELAECTIGGITFGYAICYDLRFPELYQALSKQSKIIITIANWPKARVGHWKVLLRARAIENQSVCIGVNRVGEDGNGIEYVKSSFVFDQSGNMILPEFSENEFDVFDIDVAKVNEERDRFPIKNDRRIDLYKKVL